MLDFEIVAQFSPTYFSACLSALSSRPQGILLPCPLSAQMLGGRAGEKGCGLSHSVVVAPRAYGPHVLIGSF